MKDTREFYCKDIKTAKHIGLLAELHNVKCFARGDLRIVKIEQELDGIFENSSYGEIEWLF